MAQDDVTAAGRSPDELAPRLGFENRLSGFLVALNPVGATVPQTCASCGALAESSTVEVRARDRARLIVPYCSRCHEHVALPVTQSLSLLVASTLVGVTLAGALPVALAELSFVGYVLFVVFGTVAPITTALALARGRSRETRAAWWSRSGELACTSADWATALARANGVNVREATLRRPARPLWLWAGLPIALALCVFWFPFQHPRLRMLNLSATRLSISIDGRLVAELEPTSAENPRAGALARVAAGTRIVEVRGPKAELVWEGRITLESGKEHLLAPASDGYCFWLETTHYGRTGAGRNDRVPLRADTRFWVLSVPVDSWFSPNPAQTREDERSTGGSMTALRQAPCSVAPPEVTGISGGSTE